MDTLVVMFCFVFLPGAVQAITCAAIGLGHGVTLTLCADQTLLHQLSAPQFEFARRAGLFHSQVHAVTTRARDGEKQIP